ncbi:MAG: T9SS type A sorting domain-containing protein [Ignavibacteria bacterium]|nr:T9SS type A sorting domain-containing protein [Ignavibacteria bacterium]
MINKYFYILIKVSVIAIILSGNNIQAQSSGWFRTPGSPYTYAGFQDLYFINPNTGWVINIEGPVFRTTNGGINWIMTDSISPMASLLCVKFINENTGWIGTRNPNRQLFKTTNGGFNWTVITNIPPPAVSGFQGMSLVGDSNIYLVGSDEAPSYFTRSTNGGTIWQSINLGVHATVLFDCMFFSKDSGIASGAIGNFVSEAICVVLFTSDGGVSWRNVFTGNRRKTLGWNMFFADRDLGYCAIESFSAPADYLKTTNGGLNWEFKILRNSPGYHMLAIGFRNENTGWIGGNTDTTFRTTDGGNTWAYTGFGKNLNNFQFFGDSIGYCVGQYVYKFDNTVVIKHVNTVIPNEYLLEQNYPNPFNPFTKISFSVPVALNSVKVKISVFNILGKEIRTLVNESLTSGNYEIEFDGSNLSSGVYFCKMESGKFLGIKSMILLK